MVPALLNILWLPEAGAEAAGVGAEEEPADLKLPQDSPLPPRDTLSLSAEVGQGELQIAELTVLILFLAQLPLPAAVAAAER